MTPQQLIDTKIARCFGGARHVWRQAELAGCEMCGGHGGFACDICDRCVDYVFDNELYKAIASTGFLEAEDEDDL